MELREKVEAAVQTLLDAGINKGMRLVQVESWLDERERAAEAAAQPSRYRVTVTTPPVREVVEVDGKPFVRDNPNHILAAGVLLPRGETSEIVIQARKLPELTHSTLLKVESVVPTEDAASTLYEKVGVTTLAGRKVLAEPVGIEEQPPLPAPTVLSTTAVTRAQITE